MIREEANELQHSKLVMTPEMVEAGADAAREHPLGLSLNELARSVYIAMETQRILDAEMLRGDDQLG